MTDCALVAFLRGPGPQRMPLQACCVFGLIDRADPPVCVAAAENPAPQSVCVAAAENPAPTPIFVAAAEAPGSTAATS
jgi:hypothetical protein